MLYDHQATMILLHRRQVALEMPFDNGLEPIGLPAMKSRFAYTECLQH